MQHSVANCYLLFSVIRNWLLLHLLSRNKKCVGAKPYVICFVSDLAYAYGDKGSSDMCTMTNEEDLYDFCFSNELLTLGWIHVRLVMCLNVELVLFFTLFTPMSLVSGFASD